MVQRGLIIKLVTTQKLDIVRRTVVESTGSVNRSVFLQMSVEQSQKADSDWTFCFAAGGAAHG